MLNLSQLELIGMAITSYSTKLCKYVISNQQSDLFAVFENFSDRISNPEDNIFFIQNEILDRILINVEECKKNYITLTGLYKGISKLDKENIRNIELEDKLNHNMQHSKIIGVEYFDEEVFMAVLDEELENIATNYNLNANDDYNKLYMFLSSIQLSLESSDDLLNALANQYTFYNEHSKYSSKECKDEFITIYGKKIYKVDILKKVINNYNTKIKDDKNEKVLIKQNKGTR